MKLSLLGAVCVCLCAFSVNASVTYSYSGNNFVDISDSSLLLGAYSTSDALSVSFTVDSLLSGVTATITPESFVITDGRTTFTDADVLYSTQFSIWTDAAGEITNWDIIINEYNGFASVPLDEQGSKMRTVSLDSSGSFQDIGFLFECTIGTTTSCSGGQQDNASVNGNPGTWTVSTVPIPAAVWLFGSGLLGLVGLARRKTTA